MLPIAVAILVAAAGALAVLVAINSQRFSSLVRRDALEMWSRAGSPRAIDRQALRDLPLPVRTYLEKALGSRERSVQAVRLQHGGTFRPSLDGGWLAIHGHQYFSLDPPGFVWWGRARIAPGIWIDARDRSIDGAGNMLVSAESSYTLADARGPELDQGALLRLLGEMAWFPMVFLDNRYVAWSAVDDRHARATLRLHGREGTGLFTFGDDGLPAMFSAERYRDLGNGKSVLTPFTGRLSDYRTVDGLLVPHMMVAAWIVDGRELEYVRFSVERIEFDVTATY
jgi:hypothetical protein